MNAHRLFPVAILACAMALSAPLTAQELSPQDMNQPEVANAPHSFLGQVTANNVYVRSGPGEGFYPTTKLDRGAQVTVVGVRFDWLKIQPPEGSFCYVAKAFVEQRGDGSTGRVTRPNLNVRAGSTLNAMKTTVQTRLDQGDDVRIIGEQDEYFMITPPAGAYLYVHRQFVEPIRALTADEAPATDRPVSDPISSEPFRTGGAEQPAGERAEQRPATAAADEPADDAEPVAEAEPGAEAAVTPPAVSRAEQDFDQLEAQFVEASAQEIENQPIQELIEGYQTVIASPQLPESMRRIAEHRVTILQLRAEAQEQLAEVRRIQQEAEQRRLALAAEKEELQERIRQNEVIGFAAVGVLNTSSLQQGSGILYRLTDPANGRTVIYLRTNDPGYAARIGQFLGVRGQIVHDSFLNARVVMLESAEMVDPNQVGRSITAQAMPASLLPRHSASVAE